MTFEKWETNVAAMKSIRKDFAAFVVSGEKIIVLGHGSRDY